MKKIMFLLVMAAALFLMPVGVRGEEAFTLDQTAVLNGMGRSWAQGYEPIVSNGAMTLHFPLRSAKNVGKISVTLKLADESVSPFKNGTTATYQLMDGLYRVSLRMELRPDRINGDYAATLLVSGQDADGGRLETVFPLTLSIRDGRMPEETVAGHYLNQVSADLRVGEDATLAMTLTNPSRYAAMTGITLTVTDETGDILPASSDTILLPDLLPGETADIAAPLKVLPTASVSLHRLVCALSWTALGQPGSWTETFTVPVEQEMRVEHGAVSMPGSILQDSMAALTLPVMNLGRTEVRNVIAKLTVPDVCEDNSVLVGTIAPGETKDMKLSFTPGKSVLGDVAGQLTVSYEDPWGNADSFSVPVTLTVEAPAPPPDMVEKVEKALPPWILPALGGACCFLLLLLLLQGILLRRKIRRLEEDRL